MSARSEYTDQTQIIPFLSLLKCRHIMFLFYLFIYVSAAQVADGVQSKLQFSGFMTVLTVNQRK
jgi:hypothetical protein